MVVSECLTLDDLLMFKPMENASEDPAFGALLTGNLGDPMGPSAGCISVTLDSNSER
jgi:hypothetical protein